MANPARNELPKKASTRKGPRIRLGRKAPAGTGRDRLRAITDRERRVVLNRRLAGGGRAQVTKEQRTPRYMFGSNPSSGNLRTGGNRTPRPGNTNRNPLTFPGNPGSLVIASAERIQDVLKRR